MAETTVRLEIVVDQEAALKALLAVLEDAKQPTITMNFGPITEQQNPTSQSGKERT